MPAVARSDGVTGASRQVDGSVPCSPRRAQISMNGHTGRINGPSRNRIESGLNGSTEPSGSTFNDQSGARTVAPSERGLGGSSQTQQSSGVVLPPRRAITIGGSQNKPRICSAIVPSGYCQSDPACVSSTRAPVATGRGRAIWSQLGDSQNVATRLLDYSSALPTVPTDRGSSIFSLSHSSSA